MDNAKYHLTKPPQTPNPRKMLNRQVHQYLTAVGVAWVATERAAELKEKMKIYQALHVPIEFVQIAEAQGHKVLYTPPNHSDLQPTEFVCALVKGNVGIPYICQTTLENVKERMDAEFVAFETESGEQQIEKIIRSVDKVLQKLQSDIIEEDEDDTPEDATNNGGTTKSEAEESEIDSATDNDERQISTPNH